MVILLGACAEGALLTLLQLPGAASPTWLPALAGTWALLFPAALLLQVGPSVPHHCSLCSSAVSDRAGWLWAFKNSHQHLSSRSMALSLWCMSLEGPRGKV